MRDRLIAAFERAPANGRSPEERAAALAEMRAMRLDRSVSSHFELSVATGLILRLEQTDLSRRIENGRLRESIQTLAIERLD